MQKHSDLWYASIAGEVAEYSMGKTGRTVRVVNYDDGFSMWYCRECGAALEVSYSKCEECHMEDEDEDEDEEMNACMEEVTYGLDFY